MAIRRGSPGRHPFSLRGLCLALLPVLLLMTKTGPAQAQIAGKAKVLDAGTLQIGEYTIGLYGVRSPLPDETCTRGTASLPCGRLAWEELIRVADGQWVSCTPRDIDATGLTRAACMLDDADLSLFMVVAGWALAYTDETKYYKPAEKYAREAKRGFWDDGLTPSWELPVPPGGFRRLPPQED